ncbi:hypothetical protein SMITH_336 [Smithella sp. ME-1]|uniref:Uncharacterized protein n=1 Tax=hydrocarbon metagenome TaxID=938273 RepID=A0A0W8FLR7_9ZZZZ|nr:hypothetical protein SMITH_336 [Smithella sp. ME-1]
MISEQTFFDFLFINSTFFLSTLLFIHHEFINLDGNIKKAGRGEGNSLTYTNH